MGVLPQPRPDLGTGTSSPESGLVRGLRDRRTFRGGDEPVPPSEPAHPLIYRKTRGVTDKRVPTTIATILVHVAVDGTSHGRNRNGVKWVEDLPLSSGVTERVVLCDGSLCLGIVDLGSLAGQGHNPWRHTRRQGRLGLDSGACPVPYRTSVAAYTHVNHKTEDPPVRPTGTDGVWAEGPPVVLGSPE